jgi:hypothetical protein
MTEFSTTGRLNIEVSGLGDARDTIESGLDSTQVVVDALPDSRRFQDRLQRAASNADVSVSPTVEMGGSASANRLRSDGGDMGETDTLIDLARNRNERLTDIRDLLDSGAVGGGGGQGGGGLLGLGLGGGGLLGGGLFSLIAGGAKTAGKVLKGGAIKLGSKLKSIGAKSLIKGSVAISGLITGGFVLSEFIKDGISLGSFIDGTVAAGDFLTGPIPAGDLINGTIGAASLVGGALALGSYVTGTSLSALVSGVGLSTLVASVPATAIIGSVALTALVTDFDQKDVENTVDKANPANKFDDPSDFGVKTTFGEVGSGDGPPTTGPFAAARRIREDAAGGGGVPDFTAGVDFGFGGGNRSQRTADSPFGGQTARAASNSRSTNITAPVTFSPTVQVQGLDQLRQEFDRKLDQMKRDTIREVEQKIDTRGGRR